MSARLGKVACWLAAMCMAMPSPLFAASTLEGHYEWVGPYGYHGHTKDLTHLGQYVIVDVTQNRGRWQIQWWSTVAPWYTLESGASTIGVAPAHLNARHALLFDGQDGSFHHISGRFERISVKEYRLTLQPVGKPYDLVITGSVYGTFALQRYGPVRLIPPDPEQRF